MLVIITKHDRHGSELFFRVILRDEWFGAGHMQLLFTFLLKKKRVNFKNIPTKISHKLSLIESMK